jgi:propanol-preferring alcohol dehydrogenase
MNAMILSGPERPLKLSEIAKPKPGKGQVLVKVSACGVCRTDLHVVDGDLKHPKLPLVPGHQVVGVVEISGSGVKAFKTGDRVGVPWLGGSCGACVYCRSGRENLCDKALYTGYQINGGFADYCVADERFVFPIPKGFPDLQAAPLLCAGLIGWRAYKMAGAGKRLGFYGFGAAAHLLTQVARHQGRKVYAFTRAGDNESQAFARKVGAVWAGASGETPPHPLDAAILFAPAGDLVPTALQAVTKGGTVVCAGIHMSDIPSFPYEILWGERVVRSVANLTRKDGEEFLKLALKIPIHSEVHVYPLEKANEALSALRKGKIQGAAVLQVSKD